MRGNRCATQANIDRQSQCHTGATTRAGNPALNPVLIGNASIDHIRILPNAGFSRIGLSQGDSRQCERGARVKSRKAPLSTSPTERFASRFRSSAARNEHRNAVRSCGKSC